MARVCQGCGGILGRDCFNEFDCIRIGNAMEQERHDEHQRAANDMEERFWKLVDVVERAGIDCSELKPVAPEPVQPLLRGSDYLDDGLPF